MDFAFTTYDSGLDKRLATALALSVAVHLGLGVALSQGLGWLEPRGVAEAGLAPHTPEQQVVRPGIEESRAVTMNWLGFADPTEHSADPSDLEQAGLSPNPPGNPEAAEPQEFAQAAPGASEPAEPMPTETPATPTPVAAGAPDQVEAQAPPLMELRANSPELLSSPLIKIVTRSQTAPSQAQDRARPVPPASTPGSSPTPGQPGGGLPSEKESSPTSKDESIEWHPGRPPAVEGLDITTVNPRFAITTRLSALPRNPVVRIDFRKSGAVAKAEFLPGLATGYPDVDGPLLDALYRWTAKGRALEALSAEDAEAVVSFRMRIVLIPSAGPVRRPASGR